MMDSSNCIICNVKTKHTVCKGCQDLMKKGVAFIIEVKTNNELHDRTGRVIGIKADKSGIKPGIYWATDTIIHEHGG